MSAALDEPALAALLCSELLTVAELKTLCQSRGFPLAGVGKDAIAKSASARFLEPLGVAAAMAALEPHWLKVLHLVAAAAEPVSLRVVGRAIDPALRGVYTRFDFRALWREVTTGLLAHGVALAVDRADTHGDKSRFARLHLVLPSSFARCLPPFPVEVHGVQGAGKRGDLDDVLSRAVDLFIGAKPRAGADALATQIAARLTLKAGVLSLSDVDLPDAVRIAQLAQTLFQTSLPTPETAPVTFGALALQLLGSLAPATACTADALTDALVELGFELKPPAIRSFLDDGVAAGFVLRFDRSHHDPLFRLSPAAPASTRETLELAASAKGARVVPAASGLGPLLQAASVAHASVADGAIVLEPDPVRLGRGWHRCAPSVRASLVAVSRAFRDAADLVERRGGQVVVHQGLSLLRIEDAGLYALLGQRFADAVRPIDGRHLACLAGRLDEVLALARKEGYVARRTP